MIRFRHYSDADMSHFVRYFESGKPINRMLPDHATALPPPHVTRIATGGSPPSAHAS